MSKQIISLKSLIGAISRSLSTAQEELTWSQLRALLDFFHTDETPKRLKFKIPASGDDDQDNKTEERTYQAPILSLIAPTPLHIADGKMEFNVAISELRYKKSKALTAKEAFLDLGGHDKSSYQDEEDSLPVDILVDSGAGEVNQRGCLKISMRVKAAPHQDGYDRMISKLSQLQGVWDKEEQ